jgi:DNA polymerase-4
MPESTSASFAFDRDMYDPVLVRAALLDLAVELGDRIRGRDQIARGLTLAVRLADGGTAQRTRRLPAPSAHTEDLRTGTLRLLDALAFQRARIRRLTLTAEDLTPADDGPGTQLSLDEARENRLRLEPVVDRINAKYGRRIAGPAAAYRHAS